MAGALTLTLTQTQTRNPNPNPPLTWQATLPDLGTYDAIFFDDFGAPGLSENEMMAGCASEEYRAEYAAAPSHFHAFLQVDT